MSKYTLEFFPGDEMRLPEFCVCRGHEIVFKSTVEEEAECMLEEFRISEQGAEYDYYLNQLTEFDYV